jgi:hypothetical protein
MDRIGIQVQIDVLIFWILKNQCCGTGFIESGSGYGSRSIISSESGSGYGYGSGSGSTVLMHKNRKKVLLIFKKNLF